MNKGYTGDGTGMGAVILARKSPNGWLSFGQRVRNQNVLRDRAIDENVFGRFRIFGLVGSIWRWKEAKYSSFFKFGVAKRNAHMI